MNWTGGKLQRHKHGGNGLTNRQKAFFAKQRTKSQVDQLLNPALKLPLHRSICLLDTVAPLMGKQPSRMEQQSQQTCQALQHCSPGSRIHGPKSGNEVNNIEVQPNLKSLSPNKFRMHISS